MCKNAFSIQNSFHCCIFHRRLVQGNSSSNLLPMQTKDLRKFTASVWFVDRSLVSLQGTRQTDQTTSKSARREFYYIYVFHFISQITTDFPFNVIYWEKWRQRHYGRSETHRLKTTKICQKGKNGTFFIHSICSTVNWAYSFAVIHSWDQVVLWDSNVTDDDNEHLLQFLYFVFFPIQRKHFSFSIWPQM